MGNISQSDDTDSLMECNLLCVASATKKTQNSGSRSRDLSYKLADAYLKHIEPWYCTLPRSVCGCRDAVACDAAMTSLSADLVT